MVGSVSSQTRQVGDCEVGGGSEVGRSDGREAGMVGEVETVRAPVGERRTRSLRGVGESAAAATQACRRVRGVRGEVALVGHLK